MIFLFFLNFLSMSMQSMQQNLGIAMNARIRDTKQKYFYTSLNIITENTAWGF
jgi:hypothetical protein